MNNLFFSYLLFLSLSNAVYAQNFPSKPITLVNDYAGILSAQEKQTLENKLVAYNDSTGTQIAIAIINDLEGYDRADYAVKLAKQWAIGGKDNNNGILILIAKLDRKMFIATGYGVEALLTDALCKRIEQQYMVPAFKQNNYFLGLDQATSVIIKVMAGEFKAQKKELTDSRFSFILLLIIVFIIIVIISKKGGNGGMGNRGFNNRPFMPFIGWGNLGGGGFTSGDNDFGGNSSDGFGGFGGGDFGGGGAGSDW